MAGTASRRVFRLATVFSVALVQLALQPFQAAAATDTGTLFGMNGTAVYRIDTTTGALTAFAALPPPPPTQFLPSFNGLASDPIGHRLFTVRSSASLDFSTQFYDLITIDTQSAAVSGGPAIPRGAPGLRYQSTTKQPSLGPNIRLSFLTLPPAPPPRPPAPASQLPSLP